MITAALNPEIREMASRTDRSAKKRQEFIAALAETANVLKSSEIARIARRTAYDWKSASWWTDMRDRARAR